MAVLWLTYFNAGFYDCLHVSHRDNLILQGRSDEADDGSCDVISLKDRHIPFATNLQIVHVNERLTQLCGGDVRRIKLHFQCLEDEQREEACDEVGDYAVVSTQIYGAALELCLEGAEHIFDFPSL